MVQYTRGPVRRRRVAWCIFEKSHLVIWLQQEDLPDVTGDFSKVEKGVRADQSQVAFLYSLKIVHERSYSRSSSQALLVSPAALSNVRKSC